MNFLHENALRELSETRLRYEELRETGGHFAERAALRTQLHGLRATMAFLNVR